MDAQDFLDQRLFVRVADNKADAQRNVLNRFGNPRRIARQLWFDAMKERIMSQRLQLFQTVVMTVTCLVILGLTWTVFSQNRALSEINRAFLEKLTAVPDRPAQILQSPEWMTTRVRLVLGESGDTEVSPQP